MIKQSDLRGVVEDQQSRLNIEADDLKRHLLGQLPTNLENHAKLTGRHINKELFPFSFSEFCRYTQTEPDAISFANYLAKGGFPEFLRFNNPEILSSLLDDILFRDIVVRYGIRDVRSLKRLIIFLISNVSNLLTANKLTQSLGIKSSTTLLDYLSFFEYKYVLS